MKHEKTKGTALTDKAKADGVQKEFVEQSK